MSNVKSMAAVAPSFQPERELTPEEIELISGGCISFTPMSETGPDGMPTMIYKNDCDTDPDPGDGGDGDDGQQNPIDPNYPCC